MVELGRIEAWNLVGGGETLANGKTSREHVAALEAAYRSGEVVPAVVAIHFGDNIAFALSGSHRLAALLSIYGEDADVLEDLDSEISLYDGRVLWEEGDADQREALEQLQGGPHGDAADVIRVLMPLFDDDDQNALKDQV